MYSLNPVMGPIFAVIVRVVQRVMPMHAVPSLLFGGRIGEQQRTEFAFKETVSRYKKSVRDVNRALTLTIGLGILALYAYLVLPTTGEVSVPFVGLKVSRQLWIRSV